MPTTLPVRRGDRSRRGAWLPVLLLTVGTVGVSFGQEAGPRPANPAPPSARRPRPASRVSVQFSDVDVRNVLATLADYTGQDVLVTPGAKGSVSINLRDRDADQAIRLVAAAAGLSVLRVGESYVVGPAAEIRQAAAGLGQTVLMPLRHLTAEVARELLARVAPAVVVETAGRSVVLSGLPDDLATARAALREVDIAPPAPPTPDPVRETNVVTLRFAEPQRVVSVLREAFPLLRVTEQGGTLILSGERGDLDAAGRALQSLDAEPPPVPVPEPEPEPRVERVYKLAYLNAYTAEEALREALPGLKVVAAPQPAAPPAAQFIPLSLSFLGGGLGGGGGGFGGGGGGFGGGMGAGGLGAGGGQGDLSQLLDRSTRLILIGSQSDVESAVRLLEQSDVAPARVNIEADIIEVDLRDAKDLGIRWDFGGLNTRFSLEPGDALQFGRITRSGSSFQVALNALLVENRARVLARPNISVIDNEDANVFIGDLIRFRGLSLITPDVGAVQGTETVPVGIALLVRPRVHPDGDVTLKVHPVVSSVTSIDAEGLPQTASREADTTIRLGTGEALVIAGLQREEDILEIRRVPGLSEIPLLGQLFRNRSRSRRRNEIIIVIRVREVETGAPRPEDLSDEEK